jgi:hypothetical protein
LVNPVQCTPDKSPVTPQRLWPSTDARLTELHERLVTWWFGSFTEGSELKGVWEDAFRRFDKRLREILDANPDHEERVLDSPIGLLFDCFESSLDDHDHILATFPHELPEGWYEWLPYPPDD